MRAFSWKKEIWYMLEADNPPSLIFKEGFGQYMMNKKLASLLSYITHYLAVILRHSLTPKYHAALLQLRLDFLSSILYPTAETIQDIIEAVLRKNVKPSQLAVATEYSVFCVSGYPDEIILRNWVSFPLYLYFSCA